MNKQSEQKANKVADRQKMITVIGLVSLTVLLILVVLISRGNKTEDEPTTNGEPTVAQSTNETGDDNGSVGGETSTDSDQVAINPSDDNADGDDQTVSNSNDGQNVPAVPTDIPALFDVDNCRTSDRQYQVDLTTLTNFEPAGQTEIAGERATLTLYNPDTSVSLVIQTHQDDGEVIDEALVALSPGGGLEDVTEDIFSTTKAYIGWRQVDQYEELYFFTEPLYNRCFSGVVSGRVGVEGQRTEADRAILKITLQTFIEAVVSSQN